MAGARAEQPIPVLQPPESQEPPLAGSPFAAPRPRAAYGNGQAMALDPPIPAVAIRVRVPAAVGPTQEIEYRITVQNTSQAAAHHVVVRDPLPDTATFVRATPEPNAREPELAWQLGTLEPGAVKEITLVLAPKGTGDVRNCARVQFEHGQCVTTKISRAELTLEERGPRSAALNDTLDYQLIITNNSSVPATDIDVVDSLPAGLQHKDGQRNRRWLVGTLAPGEARRLQFQVVALAVGEQCDRAVVVAAGGIRKETKHCVTVGEPKLEANLKGPDKSFVRAPTSYQVTVSNPGTAPATNVVVRSRLPAQTPLFSAGQGGRLVGDSVEWSLGTLPPTTSRVVQFSVQALTPGELRQLVGVSADHALTARAETATRFETVEEPTGVHLSVVDEQGIVEVGGTTRYAVSVFNQGKGKLTKIALTVTIPDEFEITDTQPKAQREGQKVTFPPFDLDSGREAVYNVQVRAKKAGTVNVRVDMQLDQVPQPFRKEQSTTIVEAAPGR